VQVSTEYLLLALAYTPSDNRALSHLDVSDNNIGQLVFPKLSGWHIDPKSIQDPNKFYKYNHSDGREQDEDPGEALVTGSPQGVIAIANAIPDMRALTSLNLASNDLKAKGVKIVAEAIKVTNCAIAVILVPFSCPSDHWLNCCCLLLSTG
jgi:hypothetical protein